MFQFTEGIRPTLAELERFHHTPDSLQIAAAAANAAANLTSAVNVEIASNHCFTPGDVVEVCEGDLKNLRGKVVSIEGNNRIIVQPNHSDLREPIPFTPVELRKFFNQGDHVKVILLYVLYIATLKTNSDSKSPRSTAQ